MIFVKSRLSILMTIIGITFTQITTAQYFMKSVSLDSLLQTIKDPNKKVDAIIAFLEEPQNQYLEIAASYANRAFIISQQNNYMKGNIQAMIKLGDYYFRSGDYKNAMEYAQRSREMAGDLGFNKELANSLSLIGIIYTELGDHDNSSRYFFQSLKLFEKLEDKKGIAQALGNIGLNFYNQQYYDKALEYYNNSLLIAKSIDNQSLIKKQYNNIAVVYGDLNKYDTSIVFLQKALAISIELGDKLGQGINIMNIGHIQMIEGNFDSALISFQHSLARVTEMNNPSHISECNFNFGYCYYHLNKISESIDFFKKALNQGQTIGYYTIINNSAKMLNQIFINRKDTISAYRYVLLQNKSLDSLYTFQKQDLLTKHELQYIYEKKEFELKLAQNKRDNVLLLIIFGLILGLIIVVLILSRYKLKSKIVIVEKEKIELEKEKIESELVIKDKELTVNLISLYKKNEMLIDIAHKLGQLEYTTSGKEPRNVLAQISKELRNSTVDKMLNEFSQRFQEVHAGFYEKLLSLYPDLTQNELKLCAFLRLNMSTKEIAEITGQQFTSIDKARYRLRRKLNLSGPEANLVTFLSRF